MRGVDSDAWLTFNCRTKLRQRNSFRSAIKPRRLKMPPRSTTAIQARIFFPPPFLAAAYCERSRLPARAGGIQRGRGALEICQARAFQDMNTIDRIFQDRAQFARRMTPGHPCQVRVSRRDPDLQFTDTKVFQRRVVTSGEGIGDEILDSLTFPPPCPSLCRSPDRGP